MTANLFDQRITPGHHDPAAVDLVVAGARARHRANCPDCRCIEKSVTVETIQNTYAVDDPAGGPVGMVRTRNPMISIRWKHNPERTLND